MRSRAGKRHLIASLGALFVLTALGSAPIQAAEPNPTPSTEPAQEAASDTLGDSALQSTPTSEPTPTPTPAAGWIECPGDVPDSDCPPTPEFTSVTSLAESVSLAWAWPDSTDPADYPAQTLIRMQPGDYEIVVSGQRATTIEDLDPLTQYTIQLLSIDGQQLSTPTPTRLISTLQTPSIKPQARPGEVESLIVTLVDDSNTEGDADRASRELPLDGVEVEGVQDLGTNSARVSLTEGVSEADAEVLMDDLEKDPRVASVEVDQRVFRQAFPATPPDDTYWSNLWGLHGSYGIAIGTDSSTMTSTWSLGQGSGTVVAVLDTGQTNHPDLNDNTVSGYDFVDNRSGYCRTGISDSDGDYVDTSTYGALGWDSDPSDPGDWTTVNTLSCGFASSSSWHGTHVAGTVAAKANNSAGIAGVAPLAKIQPIRVLSYDGGFTSDITAGIKWASGASISGVPANSTPADVINLSLGGSGTCTSTWQDAIDTAVANGSVVVVSAGNSNANASGFVPANCNNVITVASSTSSGVRSSFSNYGSTVEITAPGSGIWSTINNGSTLPTTSGYTSYSGTSMAAPHVAGVAALLKEADNTRTPAQILTLLQSTAMTFPTTGSLYDCTTSICGDGLLRAVTTTAPVIYSMSPSQGAIAGGESITITGANMGTATGVTIGGGAGTITATTSSTVTVTTPAHASGAVDVTVTNPDGSGTSSGGFRYFDAPVATSVDVASGSTAGGTQVVITGTDLAPSDVQDSQWIDVTFGGTAATVWLVTTTSVTVTTPAASAGSVDVVVSTAGGSSTLTNAFTYVAPISSPPPSSGGGSSSSTSSSSTASSGGGGGGGLNEISTIVPGNSGVPGSQIALAGWGLSTTRTVYFNDIGADFTVISDSQVDVIVPDVSPGVYVIHAVLAPDVGRASFWTGFSVLDSSTTPSSAVGGSPTSGGASGSTLVVAQPSADFAAFKGTSTKLTRTIRTKIQRLAAGVTNPQAEATIIGFTNAKETKASVRRATNRAKRIEAYLTKAGFNGQVTIRIQPGDSAAQRRGALMYVDPQPAETQSPNGEVSSIIVRLKAGKSITVNGQVRGSANLPAGTELTVGRNLGLRMYRLDLTEPVSESAAQRIANALAKDSGIEFAEPDSLVQAQVSRAT